MSPTPRTPRTHLVESLLLATCTRILVEQNIDEAGGVVGEEICSPSHLWDSERRSWAVLPRYDGSVCSVYIAGEEAHQLVLFRAAHTSCFDV